MIVDRKTFLQFIDKILQSGLMTVSLWHEITEIIVIIIMKWHNNLLLVRQN